MKGLYGMADTHFGDPVRSGALLLEAGVCALQLRAKGWSPQQVAHALEALAPLCRRASVPLILNDHSALAHLADGLHLGQDDGPFPQDCGLRGRSTHDLTQVQAALLEGVDYLGFGPVFGTQTKPGAGSPRGLERLAAAVRSCPKPIVAIGGVTLAQLPALRATGVAAWAVISGVLAASDPAAAARAFAGPRAAPPSTPRP